MVGLLAPIVFRCICVTSITRDITLSSPQGALLGHLSRPEHCHSLIIMVQTGPHPADGAIAAALAACNHAILAIDLLTPQEAHFPDQQNAPLLAQRLVHLMDLLHRDGDTEDLVLGFYATDYAAPAAIRAAAQRDLAAKALVVSGGSIDHAGLQYLEALAAPLLVLVDHSDSITQAATQRAFQHLSAPHAMHLIEMQAAAPEAAAWFELWLR